MCFDAVRVAVLEITRSVLVKICSVVVKNSNATSFFSRRLEFFYIVTWLYERNVYLCRKFIDETY